MPDESELLYESVAEKLRSMIDAGTYRPGERLPSLRKVHQQFGVSIATATQAYFLLENRGWIESRPQSGFYVRVPSEALAPLPRPSRPSRSHSRVSIASLHRDMVEADRKKEFVRFGAAAPDPEILPHASLNRMMARLAREAGGASNAYELPPGNTRLRRALAKRSVAFGCALDKDDIIITSGASEAIHLAVRAVAKAGDIVAVESPAYFGILEVLESLDIRAVEIPSCPTTGMDLDALRQTLAKYPVKCCIAMPNFNNPLGSLMPDDSKRELVKLLTAHDIPLIEDDIYGDLAFDGSRPKVAKAYDKKDLVILCSSFSKTLAPGYRVGWIAPGRYLERIMELKLMTTIATGTLPQLTIAEFLTHGGYERNLRKLRKTFETQVLQISRAVKTFFPEGTKVTRPMGGFVLWVEMPRTGDCLALFDRAIENGISICPGSLFSARQQYRNFVRLSCGLQWNDRTERALATLGRLAAECSK